MNLPPRAPWDEGLDTLTARRRGMRVSKPYDYPKTRKAHPEPTRGSTDWVIWAAWADRITFEEIREVSGLSEAEVIRLMRRSLTRRSFQRWRQRAKHQSLKHRAKFQAERRAARSWTWRQDESE